MARVPALSYETALTMPRREILTWLMAENERWMRDGAPVGPSPRDEERFQEYRKILRLIDVQAGIDDVSRVVLGKPGPSYWDQLPTPAVHEGTTDA